MKKNLFKWTVSVGVAAVLLLPAFHAFAAEAVGTVTPEKLMPEKAVIQESEEEGTETEETVPAEEEASEFQVSIHLEGGRFTETITDTLTKGKGDVIGRLPIPVKPGFDFDGWYSFNTYGEIMQVEPTDFLVLRDMELHASWVRATGKTVQNVYTGFLTDSELPESVFMLTMNGYHIFEDDWWGDFYEEAEKVGFDKIEEVTWQEYNTIRISENPFEYAKMITYTDGTGILKFPFGISCSRIYIGIGSKKLENLVKSANGMRLKDFKLDSNGVATFDVASDSFFTDMTLTLETDYETDSVWCFRNGGHSLRMDNSQRDMCCYYTNYHFMQWK